MPDGNSMPSASRYRATSSIAIYRRSPGNSNVEGPARGDQAANPFRSFDRQDPGEQLLVGEVSEAEQHVVHGVGASGAVLLVETLQLALDGFDGGGIEQFAKLGVAEQFPQLRRIDDERLGAPLGERRIAVVQKACDVAEQAATPRMATAVQNRG